MSGTGGGEGLTEAEREALRTSGSWPFVGRDIFVAVERILANRAARRDEGEGGGMTQGGERMAEVVAAMEAVDEDRWLVRRERGGWQYATETYTTERILADRAARQGEGGGGYEYQPDRPGSMSTLVTPTADQGTDGGLTEVEYEILADACELLPPGTYAVPFSLALIAAVKRILVDRAARRDEGEAVAVAAAVDGDDPDYWIGCHRPRPHTFHSFRDGAGRGRECGIGRFDPRPGKWQEAHEAEQIRAARDGEPS